jgi:hypothetical protein
LATARVVGGIEGIASAGRLSTAVKAADAVA